MKNILKKVMILSLALLLVFCSSFTKAEAASPVPSYVLQQIIIH